MNTFQLRFDQDDAERCFYEWGCNCGPAALAAALNMTLDEIRPHMGPFEPRGYTNVTNMRDSLESAGGRIVRDYKTVFPPVGVGLVRIQWGGPWIVKGKPLRWAAGVDDLECWARNGVRDMTEPIHLISLGAGVQSSTMALMAARGEITPMPRAAIFADTQDEPASVYRWIDWLEQQLPFPVIQVTAGRLSEKALTIRRAKDGHLWMGTAIPTFMLVSDGSIGRIQMRSCTRDFKLRPIMRASRRLAGVKRGEKSVKVIQWIGISTDEVARIKPAREAWTKSRWPLIEMRMSRRDCLAWMSTNGFPTPPRSACVYCPFHSNAEWRRLQVEEPDEFARAVEFDASLRRAKVEICNMRSVPYLHRSCKPLDQVDFRSDAELGQSLLWQDECEGMCGV